MDRRPLQDFYTADMYCSSKALMFANQVKLLNILTKLHNEDDTILYEILLLCHMLLRTDSYTSFPIREAMSFLRNISHIDGVELRYIHTVFIIHLDTALICYIRVNQIDPNKKTRAGIFIRNLIGSIDPSRLRKCFQNVKMCSTPIC